MKIDVNNFRSVMPNNHCVNNGRKKECNSKLSQIFVVISGEIKNEFVGKRKNHRPEYPK